MYGNIAWKTSLTANDATAQEQLGIIRTEVNATYGELEYKYIQNNSGGSLAANDAVVYDTTSAITVTTTTSTDVVNGAGVAVGALTNQYYGWIQVSGVATVKIKGDTDATTAGSGVGTSATAKKLGGGTGFGTALATVSTDTTGLVLLKGLI